MRAVAKRTGVDSLSERETQCLLLAGQGLTAKEIARRVGTITDQTVETYLRRAREKVGAMNTAHAVRLLEEFRTRPGKLDVLPEPVASAAESGILVRSGRGRAAQPLEEAQAPFVFVETPSVERPETAIGIVRRVVGTLTLKQHIAVAIGMVLLLMVALLGAASMLETATKLHREHPGLAGPSVVQASH